MTAQDKHAIETRDLSVRFGEVPGVLDLNLAVHVGEVYGFLGPNGAGKTTTIRLLLDLLRPDVGEVRLFGSEVRAGGAALRAHVGFLPGDLALFPFLNGFQTLRFLEGLSGREAKLRDQLLERLRFPLDALKRPVRTYSTGMRQKIGIVAAFQHDPRLLVLDEPTTGLDPIVRDAFIELVNDRRAAGRTVFLSSHVLDEIDRCADRVGLIAGARLRMESTVSELRESRPRTVVLRYADGRRESRQHHGDPRELLDQIPRDGLMEVEIRPATLDEVFRSVVGEDTR